MMQRHTEQRLPELPAVGPLMARAVFTGFGRPSPDRGLPGRTVVVEKHRQDVARLADYCRVTGFGIRDAVPATWLHVLSFPLQLQLMASSDFPFALPGLVHASNEMTLHRPVTGADTLRIAVFADHLVPHKRGVAFDLVGEIRVDGELAWSGRSTYIGLGKKLEGHPPPSPPRLEAPDVAASQAWRLPADLGRRYARVSGDSNPIHLRKLTAMPFGFSRPIIHGMWTHARALSALGPLLPETHGVRVAFTKPIALPGRVRFATAVDDGTIRLAVLNSDESKPYLVGEVTNRS